MNITARPILFISHDASRTGAPLLLLNFLKWLKSNSNIQFHVLLGGRGSIEKDFKSICPTFLLCELNENKTIGLKMLARKFILKLTSNKKKEQQLNPLTTFLIKNNYGLIYANTIATGNILKEIEENNWPIVTHIHELDFWIKYREKAENVDAIRAKSDYFIAVSNVVKNTLIRNLNISEKKISVINGFVSKDFYFNDQEKHTKNEQMLSTLGIPENAFIVGGSGTIDWRKAPDLFVQLATIIKKKVNNEKPVHFLWVGGDLDSLSYAKVKHVMMKSEIAEQVHFVGTKENPLDYYLMFDVFALVSREDPFPLVMLEAAYLAKPIICFNNSGGAREFVEEDAGKVVAYLDLGEMSNAIMFYRDNPEERNKAGLCARNKVVSRNDLSVIAPKLLRIIEKNRIN